MTRLWLAQIKAVVRLEMKKTFFARRSLWVYLLAFSPLVLFLGHTVASNHQRQVRRRLAAQGERRLTQQDFAAISIGMSEEEVTRRLGKPPFRYSWGRLRRTGQDSLNLIEQYRYTDGTNDFLVDIANGEVKSFRLQEGCRLERDLAIFASVFQFYWLRLAVFFGCLGIFMNLFRGEILDRSLHFYFLAPIRREVVMAGKYLAGLAAATVIFTTSLALQMTVFGMHLGPNLLGEYLSHNHGLAHAAAYMGVTALACLGYGSLFLAAGIFFRNPAYPAAAILIWEAANPILPALMKKFSVIYYLKSLCPAGVPADTGQSSLFAMLSSSADPVAAPVAVLGVISVALVTLIASGFGVRRLEINYTAE